MTLPVEYDAESVQYELDVIINKLRLLDNYVPLIPSADAPLDPAEGWIAVSDGTSSGFDAASGAGAYRYSGSAWVFLG